MNGQCLFCTFRCDRKNAIVGTPPGAGSLPQGIYSEHTIKCGS